MVVWIYRRGEINSNAPQSLLLILSLLCASVPADPMASDFDRGRFELLQDTDVHRQMLVERITEQRLYLEEGVSWQLDFTEEGVAFVTDGVDQDIWCDELLEDIVTQATDTGLISVFASGESLSLSDYRSRHSVYKMALPGHQPLGVCINCFNGRAADIPSNRPSIKIPKRHRC